MSEMEDLKMEAAASKIRAQFSELNAYLDELVIEIQQEQRAKNFSGALYVATWVSWIAAGIFLDDQLHYIFTMFFLFALMYDALKFTRLMSTKGEFRGVIKTLRILGYIPPRDEGGTKKKKKRKVVSEFVELVKTWAKEKEAKMGKIFSPA